MTNAERTLEELHRAQEIAAALADSLDASHATLHPDQLRAAQLVSRLHVLESMLLECPPNG